MEEVDKIIIHSLKTIGCDIDNDVVSLKEFSVERVVSCSGRCLMAINEVLNFPSTLPQSMSARFRLGTDLAAACKDLGYRGEIGYQTFLYANEHELRNVLMFLIEKLPKESSETVDEPLSHGKMMRNRIAMELRKRLSVPWTPHYTKKRNLIQLENGGNWFLQGCKSFTEIETKTFQISEPQCKFITSQESMNKRSLSPSIHEQNILGVASENEWDTEWNQMGMSSGLKKQEYLKRKQERLLKRIEEKLKDSLPKVSSTTSLKQILEKNSLNKSGDGSENKRPIKRTRFMHAEKLQFTPESNEPVVVEDEPTKEKVIEGLSKEEAEKEKKRQQEEEVKELTGQLEQLSLKFDKTQQRILQLKAKTEKANELSKALEEENVKEESDYKVKKKTIDLLPDAEGNLVKLQQVIKMSETRLVNLNDQWEKHRLPLMEKYERLKFEHENKLSDVESKVERIRILREKMKEAADDTHLKEQLLRQLVEEYERMAKDTNRSAYTKRIMEIVGNIKKQREQIAKVLQDTKGLQKDINFLHGKLDRSFTVTEELIFKDAKKEEFNRKAYKLLAGLHESFSSLVQTVEETGTIMREIRDLEEQIDNINESEIDENLEKISKDFKQIKQENNELIAKYKKHKATAK